MALLLGRVITGAGRRRRALYGHTQLACLSVVRTCGRSKLSKTGHRWLSVSAVVHVDYRGSPPDTAPGFPTSDTAGTLSDAFQTSAKANWAADAALSGELAPQGDLVSIGLGGYSPVGLVQTSLDYLHQLGLPWWGAILVCTVVLRAALFPMVVKLQSNAARLNNIRPEMDRIMLRVKQHKEAGNTILAAQAMAEMMQLYQKNNCHPFKMMIMPFLQLPIFITFFMALRGMASAPVESMKYGGMLWFTDLTVPDPYFLLPVMGCLSFLAILELGGEAGVSNPQAEKLKSVFRILAVVMVPVTSSFPTSLFMYWLPSSLFSIGQILLLKVPGVRQALRIPVMVKHPPQEQAQGGFLSKMKENYKSTQLIDAAQRRERSIKKTYNDQLMATSPKLFTERPKNTSKRDNTS